MDSAGRLTDAHPVHAGWNPPRQGHPHEVGDFTWLAPDAFMIINNHGQDHCPEAQTDGLWLYRVDSRGRQPLYQSVALELPRWMVSVRRNRIDPVLGRGLWPLDSGSWSNDVFPGALSRNVRQRIVVLSEAGCGPYRLVYIFLNDALLKLLELNNGQTIRYEQWLSRCSRVLEFKGQVRRT